MPRGDDAPDGASGIEPLKREIYAILSDRADHWADTVSLLLEHNERLSSRVDFSEHASVYEAIKEVANDYSLLILGATERGTVPPHPGLAGGEAGIQSGRRRGMPGSHQ